MTPAKTNGSFAASGYEYVVLSILLASLSIRLFFVFTSDINWDEFYYLSQVYDYQRGTLYSALQTLHVHLFGWLKHVSVNEVSQIIAARLVMYVLSLFTAFFLYLICRRFASRMASLFAVMGYCAFSFVGDHAASFRTDSISTFLLMGALFLVVYYRDRIVLQALAGLLIGVSGLVTIKAIFYVPTIGLLMLVGMLQTEHKRQAFLAACTATVVALATFAAIYMAHKSSLMPVPETTNIQILSHSVNKTIRFGSIFPQGHILVHSVSSNVTFMIAILFAMAHIIGRMIRPTHQSRANQFLLLSFALPLLTLVFYRNSFPYYYAFMLAPVSVLLAVAADNVSALGIAPQQTRRLIGILLIFLLFQLGANAWKNAHRTTQTQRATLEMVHKAFPQPVAYIDRSSMVSSFPKYGFFMSSWGFENYYAGGRALMRQIIEKYQPIFLLANIEALDLAHAGGQSGIVDAPQLFEEDNVALKENFIHHWGIVYVAGKRFDNLKTGVETKFEILIEGVYSLESALAVHLDGMVVQPGSKLFFNRGYHTIRATGITEMTVLRWGDNLYKPSYAAPTTPAFFGF